MKKIIKILFIIALFMAKEVYAITDLTFDDTNHIPKIYASTFIDGDLGGINKYYVKANQAVNFKIVASGQKVTWTRKGKEIIIEDKKPATIDINLTKSDNITCTINNTRNDIYSLSGKTFTLINQNVDLMETIIGTVSCTLPKTDDMLKLSADNWLNLEIISHDKNYVDGSTINQIISYHFYLGAINLDYLNSLNNNEEITDITFDGKKIETTDNKIDVNTNTTKINLTKTSNKNKITLKINDNPETELTNLEQVLNLSYGINNIKITETTEKSVFVSSLGNDYSLLGIADASLNHNNYEHAYILNRIDTRSKVNTLKSLDISDTKISFKANTNNYTVTVPYKASSVKISSTLTDHKSSYLPDFGNREATLNEGENTILIKVKAENGDVNTYTIKIIREKNNDASLSKLIVNDKEITIKEDLLTYRVILDNAIITPDIKAIPNDPKAKITISEIKELKEGSNEVTITVKADAGNELIYKLDIVRDNLISINSELKDIIIKDHNLDFRSNISNYTLKLNNREKELAITIIPENDKATYKVTGNKKLKNKSVIKIEVLAEDGQNKSLYTINIVKENNNYKYIIVGLLSAMLILLIINHKKVLKMKNVTLK